MVQLLIFFGPAANAKNTDDILGKLQNRDAINDIDVKNNMVLKLENHFSDPVGRMVGLNPSTGGSIPEGSNVISESMNILGDKSSVHNCYGLSATIGSCKKFWEPDSEPILKGIINYNFIDVIK